MLTNTNKHRFWQYGRMQEILRWSKVLNKEENKVEQDICYIFCSIFIYLYIYIIYIYIATLIIKHRNLSQATKKTLKFI